MITNRSQTCHEFIVHRHVGFTTYTVTCETPEDLICLAIDVLKNSGVSDVNQRLHAISELIGREAVQDVLKALTK